MLVFPCPSLCGIGGQSCSNFLASTARKLLPQAHDRCVVWGLSYLCLFLYLYIYISMSISILRTMSIHIADTPL